LSLGSNNTAIATGAVAMGLSNTADSAYSVAIGFNSLTTGHSAVALGESINSQSVNCVTVGSYNIAEGDMVNWVATDPIFVVGNGTASGGSSDAMKVLKNGTLVLPTLSTVTSPTYLLCIDANGNVGNYTSSIRYKTNVSPLNDVSWIYDLNPVNFVYKNDPGKSIQSGLIAEDVEKVNKQYVIYKNGLPDGVSYQSMFAPIIKAIQDQKKTIESLKSENELLRERLEKLESIVSTITQGQK
jgi:Chaperone of endosialidase/Head domain of trimeric autotransporter adhesin